MTPITDNNLIMIPVFFVAVMALLVFVFTKCNIKYRENTIKNKSGRMVYYMLHDAPGIFELKTGHSHTGKLDAFCIKDTNRVFLITGAVNVTINKDLNAKTEFNFKSEVIETYFFDHGGWRSDEWVLGTGDSYKKLLEKANV